MNKVIRRAALLVAAAAALTLPTPAAHAQEPLPCPRIPGVVCTFSEPFGQGLPRLLRDAEPFIAPPVRSAQNQDFRPWCFFSRPQFTGDRVELQRGEVIDILNFGAFSARPGPCFF